MKSLPHRLGGAFLLALSLLLCACGGGNGEPQPSAYAPVEAPIRVERIDHYGAPAAFFGVVGWMQAIDVAGTGTPSKVEVDYLRVHAVVQGIDVLILNDNFPQRLPGMEAYGLYQRSPWFLGGRLEAMPFTIVDGSILTMEPGTRPSRVFRWENTFRAPVPINATRIWAEARVRITGGAGVQLGLDYWRTAFVAPTEPGDLVREAGASNWFGNSTGDWQIITFAKP